MTITVFIIDPAHTVTTALPVVEQVESELFDSDGNYIVQGASLGYTIPVEYLHHVEKVI
jgi:hypothetical protein